MSQHIIPAAGAGSAPRRGSGHPSDVEPWPDIVRVPRAPARARAAKWLFERLVPRLEVSVEFPDGRRIGAGAASGPTMRLVRPEHFFHRVGTSGLIGFGEAYQAGDWASDDISGVLTVFARRMPTLVPPLLQRLRDLAVLHQPARHRGTVDNSRVNISHHYDLSNDLFATFLDPTLSYSSALFERADDGMLRVGAADLAGAQHHKIDRLLDSARVHAGTRLLEIGTGWGELAIRAARRGATVHSITLSDQQLDLARQRVSAAGVSRRVQIELSDYRAVTGQYDAIVSVEMVEAVGYNYWPTYFSTLDRLLEPGGRVGLQAITMPHDRMLASRDTYTWIQKYIFPGGLLPSVTAIEENVAEHTGLTLLDRFAFGAHYAQTLRLWRERFDAAAGQVERLGFDETFRRMWRLYLAYSEAGFASGYLDVYQFTLAKPMTAAAVRPIRKVA